ncbi:RDD family protein [Streptomyces sp. ADI96-02]|uniref:RDD family protein n=1 Tax=Streptomyces sp. ADI96-02 TaxID=1522760 RepID=UPI000F558E04|nr:RDD family protein [Streptomyces sp. ADI96-02]RPK64392.1 RDD family protein [Streptomyces sp. ADI96-02]
MSAPTPAPGDESPREGYYPDPSIPGYVRYWNGASWVPGTSRPAPDQQRTASAGAPMEETGPIFFDEEDDAPDGSNALDALEPGPAPVAGAPHGAARSEAASVWQADTARQGGFGGERDRRVSWGDPVPEPAAPPQDRPGRPAPAGQPAPAGPADPRTAADPRAAAEPRAAADPRAAVAQVPDPGSASAGGALPGMPDGGGRTTPGGAGVRPPTEGTVTIRALDRGGESVPPRGREADAAPGEGTLTIRATGSGAVARRPSGSAPQPPTALRPAAALPPAAVPPDPAAPRPAAVPPQAVPPVQQQPAPAAPQRAALQGPVRAPAPDLAPVQPAPPAPMASGSGGGTTSWAQQVHQLAQPEPRRHQPFAQPGADQPVVPWKPPVDDPFQQLARSQAAARPAGLGKRFAARLVDSLVLGAAVGAVAAPLATRALDHIDRKISAAEQTGRTVTVWLLDSTTGALLGTLLAAFLVLGFLLEALPTAKWGRTLGKKLLGLDVRDIESHDAPSLGAALRRWLVYGVLGLLVIGVANVLWCLVDRPWRQCWHDKAARTFVAG